ncbi:MAG: hypothetical protein KF915_00655 [Polyangiaceae bacterium]|nr:hypothetical protein [Polyangiaceae bacterium]
MRQAPRTAWVLGVALSACACGGPPPSQLPSAAAAIERMRATQACSRGLRADAKIDYFGTEGRVRTSALFLAARPESLRFDVLAPSNLGMALILTTNGERFALADNLNTRFITGPALTCNVERFTQVPVPPHALVTLLGGEAPILVHEPGAATLSWNGHLFGGGEYVLELRSKHEATQTVHLTPYPSDWDKPWREQRFEVSFVRVVQRDYVLYEATLRDYQAARTAGPLVDPDGLDPDVPPSGPTCSAALPRSLRIEVPEQAKDLTMRIQSIEHNPPLLGGSFEQSPAGGMQIERSNCRD